MAVLPSICPRLEALESRCCPAVLFDFEAGVLRLTGDAEGNVVEITQRQDGVLEVVADGERRAFEGVDEIFASLGDGDDTVRSSKPKEIVVVGSKIKENYDLGGGNDTLYLADRSGDVENKIGMGAGDDSIWIDIGAPARADFPNDFPTAVMEIDLGGGDDRLRADLQNFASVQLTLLGDAGDDAVAVRANDRLRTAGPVDGWGKWEDDLNLGAGDDRLLIDTDGYGDVNSLVDAGDGNDAAQVRHRMFDATVEGDVDAEGQESHGSESPPSWADRWTVTCRRAARSA